MKLNYNKLMNLYNKGNDDVSDSLGLADLEDFEDFVEQFCRHYDIVFDHDDYLQWFDKMYEYSFELFGNGHVGIMDFNKVKKSLKSYCDIEVNDVSELTSEMLENLVDTLSKIMYNKYVKDVYGVEDEI